MPSIRLKNIKNFICGDINLEIQDKEFLVLWGPTGAGKTTLLNVIAGLMEYEGTVLFDGVPVDELPVYQRKAGYLFQNLILFPHLDVKSNIAYGLTVQRKPKKEAELKAEKLLKLMKIEHLAERFPKDLSGGEKQRVALARAIAPSPEILLLDEPLNNLDSHIAKYLRMEIRQLQRELGITTVYVTHCFEEAFALADRVAVLNNGKIVQVDSPENIFEETDCRMVAEAKYCNCHKGGENGFSKAELESNNASLCHLP
ncbi:MAG: ABC transporter ATP-binding protein [Planctomycetes bacterium]|nr:ABC transporter ATP-binding protein [Planctomycetota bacterium]